MAKQKKGFITRLVEGKEKSEDYARRTLPSSRWSLGWDLIKTNLGKLFKINLLMILFLFPVFLIFIFRDSIVTSLGYSMPFSQNVGIGYPSYPYLTGFAEKVYLNADSLIFMGALIVSAYLSVGISGGFYVMRNLVWTEGVFVFVDFFRGVKKNFISVFLCTVLYITVIGFSFLSIDLVNIMLVSQTTGAFIGIISKIISYVLIALFSIMYLFTITLTVTYKLSVFKLIRNAVIFTISLLPMNIFFVALSLLPFIFLLFSASSIFFMFGIIFVIVISISLFTLIFTNYSQWAFDEFLNDKVAGAKKNRGIYKKIDDEVQNDASSYTIIRRPIKPITDYDIEIEALPESYSRKDLIRLEESKKRMIEDSDKYVLEHQAEIEKASKDVDSFMKEGSKNKKSK